MGCLAMLVLYGASGAVVRRHEASKTAKVDVEATGAASSSMMADKCKVTLYESMDCKKKVSSFSTNSGNGKEITFGGGKNENNPNSLGVDTDGCADVEIYDEDATKRGYEDNSKVHSPKKGLCVKFPYDLQEDVGGLYLRAAVDENKECKITAHSDTECSKNEKNPISFATKSGNLEVHSCPRQAKNTRSIRIKTEHCRTVKVYDNDMNYLVFNANDDKVIRSPMKDECYALDEDRAEDIGGIGLQSDYN